MLVACGLMSLLLMGIYTYLFTFNSMRSRYSTDLEITNEARAVLEKMVWGVAGGAGDERHGIWEAQSLSVVSDTQLDYTDPDGGDHTIRVNNQSIEMETEPGEWTTIYDPNGEGVVDDASEATTSVIFTTISSRIVQIQLVLAKNINGGWHYASLSTQVHARN